MPSFFNFLRPKPRPKSAPPTSRHNWPRRRRSQSTVMPLTQETQLPVPIEEVAVKVGQDGAEDIVSCHTTEQPQSNDRDESSSLKKQPSNTTRPSHNKNDGSDNSQSQSQAHSRHGSQIDSQRGSKRIKDFITRFRSSRSQDHSSVSEVPQISFPVLPQDAAGDPIARDPIKQDDPSQPLPGDLSQPAPVILSGDPSADDDQNAPDQRNVSAQTLQSQDSSATVYRHPSQRIPGPIREHDDVFWASLLNFQAHLQKDNMPTQHQIDPSDPFSDGKVECGPRLSIASSHHSDSHSHSQKQPQASASVRSREAVPLSKTPSSHHTSSGRISSGSSHGSRRSRFSRIDPVKAAASFDDLAARLNIAISIREQDSLAKQNRATEEELESRTRTRRRFGRVRAAQSISTLGEASPKPKLRHMKTFANLGRRSSPMSSLRGKPIEDIARLGGHSYLMLPLDLAPAPLQLPACIVAMVIYLKKSFSRANPMPRLFDEPGDVKAATRLYNHFASQVLLAERDADRIAMTMRIVALPHMETESDTAAVLSVGWVFKEILAGLPYGILGSVPLHKVLNAIYLAGTSPYRVRLITFAILALTSEMQCALICAVFGLLKSLMRVDLHTSLGMPYKGPGNEVRTVATHSKLDPNGLARVFAPLLLGRARRPADESVEQEIQDDRVMGMLIEHWGGVNRLLWDLTEHSPRGRRQED